MPDNLIQFSFAVPNPFFLDTSGFPSDYCCDFCNPEGNPSNDVVTMIGSKCICEACEEKLKPTADDLSSTCIIVTFPHAYFQETSPSEFAQKFLSLTDTHHWLCPMANRPKKEPKWCYVTALGRLRYRAKVLGFEIGGEREFADGTTGNARHWLVLAGPVIKAPRRIQMNGFQGFRYTEFIF